MSFDKNSINDYVKHDAADMYIIGQPFKKVVYYAILTPSEFTAVKTRITAASCKADGLALRFIGDTENYYNFSKKWIPLCSVEQLKAVQTKYKYPTAGHAFERIIQGKHRKAVDETNPAWYNAPDMTLKGVGYQIKYADGTITNERALKIAMSR